MPRSPTMNHSRPSPYKQNRLKQLRAFCHAADTGTISKAADAMELSQPSVSLLVRALEREFDATLFERRGPRIRLTPQGRILHELATPLLEAIESLPEVFAERCSDVVSGELHIAAGESTILYILPDVVRRFASNHPGVHFNLHNVTGRDGLALLRANRVDFAVGSMLEVPEDISYQPIVRYQTVLITPLGHPLAKKSTVSLEDISPYGLILPPRHLSTWRMVDLVFQQHGVPYRVNLEAGGWEVIKEYVRRGLGISIVTSICLNGGERLQAIPLGAYFPDRSYGLVLRKGKHLSPAARRFIALLDPDQGRELGAAGTQ